MKNLFFLPIIVPHINSKIDFDKKSYVQDESSSTNSYRDSSSDILIDSYKNQIDIVEVMDEEDRFYKFNREPIQNIKEDIIDVYNACGDVLNEYMGTGRDIKTFVDEKAVRSFVDYIEKNWDKYVIDGNLVLTIYTRYTLCCFTFIFIPSDSIFVLPKIIIKSILKIASRDVSAFSKLKKKVARFFDCIASQSNRSFLLPITIGFQNVKKGDIAFFKKLPYYIKSDIKGLVKELKKITILVQGCEK